MANQINTLSSVRPPSVSHDEGDRVNDIHLSINDKQKARKEKKNLKAYDVQALHRKTKRVAGQVGTASGF